MINGFEIHPLRWMDTMSGLITLSRYCCVSITVLLLVQLLVSPISSTSHIAEPFLDNVSSVEDGSANLEQTDHLDVERELKTISRTFNYERPLIERNPFVEGLDVAIPGISQFTKTSEPCLPADHITIALEPGSQVSSIDVQLGNFEVIPLDLPVTPNPEPLPVTRYTMFDGPEDYAELYVRSPTYQTSGTFPPEGHYSKETFGISPTEAQGRNMIILSEDVRSNYVDVTLFPVTYDPCLAKLYYHSSIELEVTYYEPVPASPGTRSESYDMVIITPQNYVATYRNLADHRNSTGVETKVVGLNEIYNGYYFPTQGADNPERIKYFIWNATVEWGIRFVLLGGDSSQVPVRYVSVDDGADGTNTPSDLYYSDIKKANLQFASWDSNDDGKWGEYTVDVYEADFRPDVLLGRLPSASTSQANNMINKIINYEAKAPFQPFLKNATFLGLDTFTQATHGDNSGVFEGEDYCENLQIIYYNNSKGWTSTSLYDSLGTLSTSNFNKDQAQQVGIMTFSDHGLETSWGNSDIHQFTINSMDNGYQLPLVSVDACKTGAFDYFSDSFGETFLKNSNGGGIGCFAASRIGFGTHGTMHKTRLSGLINTNFHKTYVNDFVLQIGEVNAGAQNKYVSSETVTSESHDYKTIVEYVFFGDPATYVGGYSKTDVSVYYDDVDETLAPGGAAQYNISIENTGSSKAVVQFFVDNPKPEYIVQLSSAAVEILPSENLTVTMTVNAPGNAEAEEVVEIILKAHSLNFHETPIEMVTTTTIKTIYEHEFRCFQPNGTIKPGNSTFFYFSVDNTCNRQFYYNFSIQDAPPFWNLTFSENPLQIAKFDDGTVILNIDADDRATPGINYINVYCQQEDSILPPSVINISIEVLKTNGIDVKVKTTLPQEQVPGNASYIELDILNLGNHQDIVDLTGMESTGDTEWSIEFIPSQITLPAFSNGSVWLKISSPVGTLAGDYTVDTTSKLASDLTELSLPISITILPQYWFEISVAEDTQTLEKERSFKFKYTVRNIGNQDDKYTFSVEDLPTGFSTIIAPDEELEPLQEKTFDLVVKTGEAALISGTYNITLVAASTSSALQYSQVFTIVVPPAYGVDAWTDASTLSGDPGTWVEFVINVENLGNTPDNLGLTIKTESSLDHVIDPPSILVAPAAREFVTINVTIPEDEPAGSHTFNLKAVSQGDTTLEKVIDLTLKVNQIFKLEFTSGETEFKALPGEIIQIGYNLKNLGNGQDIFRLSFEDKPKNWEVEYNKTVSLDISESFAGTIDLTIAPSEAGGDTYTIKLKAASDGDPSVIGSVEITIETEVTEPEPEPVEPTNNETTTNEGGFKTAYLLFGLIPLILLIIIAVGVVFILMKRKKDPEPVGTTEAGLASQMSAHSAVGQAEAAGTPGGTGSQAGQSSPTNNRGDPPSSANRGIGDSSITSTDASHPSRSPTPEAPAKTEWSGERPEIKESGAALEGMDDALTAMMDNKVDVSAEPEYTEGPALESGSPEYSNVESDVEDTASVTDPEEVYDQGEPEMVDTTEELETLPDVGDLENLDL